MVWVWLWVSLKLVSKSWYCELHCYAGISEKLHGLFESAEIIAGLLRHGVVMLPFASLGG